jgi:hypothetical protein
MFLGRDLWHGLLVDDMRRRVRWYLEEDADHAALALTCRADWQDRDRSIRRQIRVHMRDTKWPGMPLYPTTARGLIIPTTARGWFTITPKAHQLVGPGTIVAYKGERTETGYDMDKQIPWIGYVIKCDARTAHVYVTYSYECNPARGTTTHEPLWALATFSILDDHMVVREAKAVYNATQSRKRRRKA